MSPVLPSSAPSTPRTKSTPRLGSLPTPKRRRPATPQFTAVELEEPKAGRYSLGLVVVGFLMALVALNPSLRNQVLASFGLASSSHSSVDHAAWRTWQRLQAQNPVSPNHDPLDLGTPPPEDLVLRRQPSMPGNKGHLAMPLPKKVDMRPLDEL